jgi:hypothetical protein
VAYCRFDPQKSKVSQNRCPLPAPVLKLTAPEENAMTVVHVASLHYG